MLDQGGHATRAIIFSQSGEIIFHTESKIRTIEKTGNIVEHDSDELLNSFDNVLSSAEDFLQKKNLDIVSLGLATQRSSFVAVNADTLKAIGNIISWQDRRSASTLEKYQSNANKIYQQTGLVLNAHYGASKMRWCLENNENVKKAAEKSTLLFAPIASYILLHILNEKPFLVDPANASRTLLMNLETCAWDQSLLDLFEIDESYLPKIHPTFSNYGTVTLNSKKIPLKVCTGDQNATLFAHGQPKSNEVYVNVGTGAFILNVHQELHSNIKSKILKSILYKSEETSLYALEGTVNGAGRALQWLAEKHNIESYETELNHWLSTYTDPPIFINGISGLGSPFWVPELESYFEFETSVEEKFVAVAESIIFLIKVNIDILRNEQPSINQIILSGGLSNNKHFCQHLANLCLLPILVSTDSEATAKGVYTLLNKAKDSLFQCETFDSQHSFQHLRANKLEQRFNRWKQLLSTQLPDFK